MDDDKKRCTTCRGTGRVEDVGGGMMMGVALFGIPMNVMQMKKSCTTCSGTGKVR